MYHVSSSPHVRDNSSTQRIMLDVVIALLPACLFGVMHFGAHAALILVISVLASVGAEAAYESLMKK